MLSALPPLSTDMYLAAIPQMAAQWDAPIGRINLSLELWFASFSVSLLFYGALSDRVGRRPVLLGGLMLFAIASALCAFASSPLELIAARVLQGVAAAAPSSMTLAYCRDHFEGKTRQHILAWIGIILSMAPMVAPSIGVAVMRIAPWNAIFGLLALISTTLLVLAWFYFDESLAERESGGIAAAFQRYGRLTRNRNFLLANGSMCLIACPILGYVGIASPVYIGYYGLSETQFGLIFALMPLCSMAGSYLCTRLLRHTTDRKLILWSLCGCVTAGLSLTLLGSRALAGFALSTAVFGFFAGISRPLSNHLILEQVSQDIGAASSTIIFTQFMAGALCMSFTTAGWITPILSLGFAIIALPGLVLLLWPILLRRLRFEPAASHV